MISMKKNTKMKRPEAALAQPKAALRRNGHVYLVSKPKAGRADTETGAVVQEKTAETLRATKRALTGRFMGRTIYDAPVKFSKRQKAEIEEWVTLMRG